MVPKQHLSFLFVFGLFFSWGLAQEQVYYKQVDTTRLKMEVHRTTNPNATEKSPAMVFFFGGGWKGGTLKHFEHHARYLSQRGITCFLIDYRVESRQQTTPFESLKDAKSAIRHIRSHAATYGIDPNRIIASGGSAGGHLAAATALVEGYSEATDDRSVSAVPNALVLFNPVIDNGPGGYGYERIGKAYKEFSPLHNIQKGAPPTIFFLGTEDALIPVETAQYYQKMMERVGSRCELHLFEGEAHGFFNYGQFEHYKATVSLMDTFLQSLGYLKDTPQVPIE